MRRHLAILAVVAVGSVWLAGAAGAGGEKKVSDKQFVAKAASSGMAEVKLGELAEERGVSAAVKKFGHHMVKDHTKANKELMELASSKGYKLPGELSKARRAAVEKLSKLKGEEFDRAFAKQMVLDHVVAVKLFEYQAKNGTDEALKAFAAKTLPVLQEHLEMAKKLPGAPSGSRSER